MDALRAATAFCKQSGPWSDEFRSCVDPDIETAGIEKCERACHAVSSEKQGTNQLLLHVMQKTRFPLLFKGKFARSKPLRVITNSF